MEDDSVKDDIVSPQMTPAEAANLIQQDRKAREERCKQLIAEASNETGVDIIPQIVIVGERIQSGFLYVAR